MSQNAKIAFKFLLDFSKDENFLGVTVTKEPGISPIPTVIKNQDASYEINTP